MQSQLGGRLMPRRLRAPSRVPRRRALSHVIGSILACRPDGICHRLYFNSNAPTIRGQNGLDSSPHARVNTRLPRLAADNA